MTQKITTLARPLSNVLHSVVDIFHFAGTGSLMIHLVLYTNIMLVHRLRCIWYKWCFGTLLYSWLYIIRLFLLSYICSMYEKVLWWQQILYRFWIIHTFWTSLNIKQWFLSCCLYVCICALLVPERLDGFYSYSRIFY